MDTILNFNTVCNTYKAVNEEAKYENHVEDEKILEDRLLKEIQRREYLEAKHIDEQRKKLEMEEEQRRQEEEELKRQEAERKQREVQEQKAIRLASIPQEPEPDPAKTSEIAFRLASGKRITRRFPKNCTIQVNRDNS